MSFLEFLFQCLTALEVVFIVTSLIASLIYPFAVVCWDEGLWRPKSASWLFLGM